MNACCKSTLAAFSQRRRTERSSLMSGANFLRISKEGLRLHAVAVLELLEISSQVRPKGKPVALAKKGLVLYLSA